MAEYWRFLSISERNRWVAECPHPEQFTFIDREEEVKVIVCRRCGRSDLFTARSGPLYPQPKEQVKDLGEE